MHALEFRNTTTVNVLSLKFTFTVSSFKLMSPIYPNVKFHDNFTQIFPEVDFYNLNSYYIP